MTAILLEHFHGAVTRSAWTETAHAAPARAAGLPHPRRCGPTPPRPRPTSPGPADLRGAAAHLGSGRWLNYLGDDQADEAIRAAYGPNYDRLVEVKRRYDPENVFHLNHNIAP